MQVRLVRSADQSQDDIITIRPRANGGYLVRYTEGTRPDHVWVDSKTKSEVLDYIENILVFFKADRDPFHSIQVTLPGWPIIYIGHAQFDDEIMVRIVDSIEMCLDNIPAFFTQ